MGTGRSETGQTITLPDGRKLGYLSVGEGKPVFVFPGFPGSRLIAMDLEAMARSCSLRLIGIDRPGFGLSTYASKTRVRDFAADVALLADYLGIGTFALAAYSAGGHYAIGCTALLPKRVTRTVVVSGLALPPDTSGMCSYIQAIYRFGAMPVAATWIQKRNKSLWFEIDKDPGWLSRSKVGVDMLKPLPESDRNFLMSIARVPGAFKSAVETYLQGPDSIRAAVQQLRLQKKGWDVDLSMIPSGIVYLWHGTADVWVPIGNAHKNSRMIPGAHLRTFDNEGHFLLYNHLNELGQLLAS